MICHRSYQVCQKIQKSKILIDQLAPKRQRELLGEENMYSFLTQYNYLGMGNGDRISLRNYHIFHSDEILEVDKFHTFDRIYIEVRFH